MSGVTAARAPMDHDLKCWPDPFAEVKAGNKKFEWRYNDRDYAEGDRVTLYEYDPDIYDQVISGGETEERATAAAYTGEKLGPFEIGFVLTDGFEMPPGYCVFSLRSSRGTGGALPEGCPELVCWDSKARKVIEVPRGWPCGDHLELLALRSSSTTGEGT